ncbi:MAG: phosphatase PAP2 family protein [Xanthobacteraceae bacterium]|nr:phosphatase PAP2 family protein [Xanthobacteraceae bacterium]
MNRTGLFIALTLALVFGLIFTVYPTLDLSIAARFYNPQTKIFPMGQVHWAILARNAAMWLAWAFVIPSILAIVVKLFRPVRPLMIPGRKILFLLGSILISAVLLSNVTFKTYWGRPRPAHVVEFNGDKAFVPWWDPRGTCPKNCSFFSGEGATAFWTYAPAALTPPQWRPVAYLGATLFGIFTGGLRMTFGGHFATDVIASGLVSFFVIWVLYALIYRWPSTRLTDEEVDAWLTQLAWPGYRWRQRLFGRNIGPAPRVRQGQVAARNSSRRPT